MARRPLNLGFALRTLEPKFVLHRVPPHPSLTFPAPNSTSFQYLYQRSVPMVLDSILLWAGWKVDLSEFVWLGKTTRRLSKWRNGRLRSGSLVWTKTRSESPPQLCAKVWRYCKFYHGCQRCVILGYLTDCAAWGWNWELLYSAFNSVAYLYSEYVLISLSLVLDTARPCGQPDMDPVYSMKMNISHILKSPHPPRVRYDQGGDLHVLDWILCRHKRQLDSNLKQGGGKWAPMTPNLRWHCYNKGQVSYSSLGLRLGLYTKQSCSKVAQV